MTSTRPYLIRALYEWIVDNNCTPHILVNADYAGVKVPAGFAKDGQIVQVRLDLTKAGASGTLVRTLQVPSQAEGCVVYPRTGTLYVGEEAAGVWTFDARPRGPTEGRLAVRVDNVQLTADVELHLV